jgi:DNA-binding NtrC family response regulator
MSSSGHGDILVADGDPAIRSLLAVLVKRMARRPVAAPDCATVLRLLDAYQFEAAVIDLRLPSEDGKEVLREIAVHSPDLLPHVVVITTGRWRPDGELKPVAAVLRKPFALDDLTAALEACCGGSPRADA